MSCTRSIVKCLKKVSFEMISPEYDHHEITRNEEIMNRLLNKIFKNRKKLTNLLNCNDSLKEFFNYTYIDRDTQNKFT